MVLIPKGDVLEFRGVGLVEILWKTTTVIINRKLNLAIRYHDTLHGFWSGRRTGTATPNSKLLQQLTDMREEELCEILLGLNKSYNALERDRCINILAGYVMGTSTLRLLSTYWVRLQMMMRAGGYY